MFYGLTCVKRKSSWICMYKEKEMKTKLCLWLSWNSKSFMIFNLLYHKKYVLMYRYFIFRNPISFEILCRYFVRTLLTSDTKTNDHFIYLYALDNNNKILLWETWNPLTPDASWAKYTVIHLVKLSEIIKKLMSCSM